MIASIPKRLLVLLASSALAIALVPMFAHPQPADALALTTAAANYSSGSASELHAGSGITEEFVDYESGYSRLLESHWFKYKTSNRRSVYKVWLEDLDGQGLYMYMYNADGRSLSQVNTMWSPAATILAGSHDKNAWYTLKVAPTYSTSRYSKFKVSLMEYPVLSQVYNLKASKKSKRSLSIKWAAQTNATKYQVRYKAKGGSWKTAMATGNSAKLKKLKAGTKYQVKVRAFCKNGWNAKTDKKSNWGTWSAVKTVKTKG